MFPLDQKDHGIIADMDIGEVFLGLHQIAEQKIQLVLVQKLAQHPLIPLLKSQFHIGVIAAEDLQGGGNQMGGAADGDAHPQPALVAADHLVHLLLELLPQGQNFVGLLQIDLPQIGGDQPAAGALEQRGSQGVLHVGQIGEGRLRHAKALGRLGDASTICNCDDVLLLF